MIEILSIITLVLIFCVEVYKNIIIYQQNQYIIKRYLKTIVRKTRLISGVGLIALLLVIIIKNSFIELLLLLMLLFISVVVEYNKHYKVKFKFTFRMKRFFATIILVVIVATIFVREYAAIIILLNSLFLVLMHYVNMPMESYIRKSFINKARKKLSSTHAKVVGITGSYGKTTSKNILYDILKKSKYTLPTPASFNTPMGISITINNELTSLHEVFIAEMGAYVVGEIKENCDVVSPDIAIITSIGSAHLESFGSRENILKGKFELVESLPKDGLAVLNADDEVMMSYEIKNQCNILTYSIENESDLRAYDVKSTVDGVVFKFDYENETYTAKSKLLGKHNVYNILACILVARHLDIPMSEIITSIKDVNVISHRLELRKSVGSTIIDDAFNSNPVGAAEAANVLGQMDGYKVAMTPGMVELGEEEYELNKVFAKQLAANADFVYVVGKNRSKPFVDGFEEVGYTNYVIVANVDEGFRKFFSIKDANKILLIENDLSDIY